jgi:AraC-like DNA-binding protein
MQPPPELTHSTTTDGDPDRICNDKSRLPGFLDEIDVRLLYAAFDDLPAGAWNHERLVNDFWRLYQNDAASGTVVCGDEPIDLVPNGVYLIPSGLNLASKNSAHIGQFFVHFDLRGVPPFAFRDLFPSPVLVDSGADFAKLVAEVGQKVASIGIDDIALQCQLKGIIYAAFGYYLENLPGNLIDATWARLQAMQPVAPALQMIERQLEQPLTNRELANACAMSENHFIRRFRQAIGLTPASFIQQKRLAAAAQLLLYTDESIDAIALKTGFSDRFYFSRAFRRAMGRPPATYRRLPRT